ncbi:MAG: thioesterase family protein [Deltaproteobacteria bacterium]|jgi:hypothetical protein|nr:thioesterase family protein [Deltaproteobacteria bacterium]MBW2537521.1 thioesterase family protein [Deltaproteobacteria bacterium]
MSEAAVDPVEEHGAFYLRDGDMLVGTPLTRGPWDDRFQHGGPPAAVLTGALERFEGGEAFALTRMAIELLRPVPIEPLRVAIDSVRGGRSVQRIEASLSAGDQTVAVARGLRVRRAPMVGTVPIAPEPWPAPNELEDYVFSFFRNEVGYHRAVQLRIAQGAWGITPVGVWARPRVPLVAGEPTSPTQQLMLLADAQSGMGPPLDPQRYSFANPDLTVYFERPPVEGWFGFDIRSVANEVGWGLAQSAVRDAKGMVARSAQSLLVLER